MGPALSGLGKMSQKEDLMSVRQLITVLAAGVMAYSGLAPTVAAAQDYEEYPLAARVWLDRGEEPVLQRGERARIYYRVSESAFVAIFHIDTNGLVQMVFFMGSGELDPDS